MNTRLFAGSEAQLAQWLRPSLAAAAAAAAQSGQEEWGADDVAIHVRSGDILWGHHAAYSPLPLSFYRAALLHIAQKRAAEQRRAGEEEEGGRRGAARAARRSSSSGSAAAVPAQPPARSSSQALSLGTVVLIAESPRCALLQRLAAALESEGVQGGRGSPGSMPRLRAVRIQSSSIGADLASLFSAPALILSISSFAWWPALLSCSAKAVVMPVWGLLKPHSWAPRPQLPSERISHCMTIAAVPEEEEGEGGGGEEKQRIGAASGPCRQAARLQSLAAALTAALGPADAARGHAAAPRVLELELPALQCWGGNTAAALDTLFD